MVLDSFRDPRLNLAVPEFVSFHHLDLLGVDPGQISVLFCDPGARP